MSTGQGPQGTSPPNRSPSEWEKYTENFKREVVQSVGFIWRVATQNPLSTAVRQRVEPALKASPDARTRLNKKVAGWRTTWRQRGRRLARKQKEYGRRIRRGGQTFSCRVASAWRVLLGK
jgi:hypothetical protein